ALRRSGDDWSIAYALVPLGNVALLAGDLAGAARRHEEALALARGIGDEHLMATLLDQLGLDALLADHLPGAQVRLGEAAGRPRPGSGPAPSARRARDRAAGASRRRSGRRGRAVPAGR